MRKNLGKIACTSLENAVIHLFIERIRALAVQDKSFLGNAPGFLINPKTITFYWFDEHVAISFEGDERVKCLSEWVQPEFIHRNLFSEHRHTFVFSAATGLDLNKSTEQNEVQVNVSLGIISGAVSGRGFLFTGSVLKELLELGWRIETFNTAGVILGFQEYAIPKGSYFSFQNIFVCHECAGEGVSIHHIKWLEVIPYRLGFDSNGEINDISASSSLLSRAAKSAVEKKFFVPTTYEQVKFDAVNRFVELWGRRSTKETAITRFFEDESHKFILTMHFGAKDVYPELSCSKVEKGKEAIRPDFFIEKSSGVCDIVEFKLPRLTSPIVVGLNNRRRFSSWFGAHLAQAQAYRRYFSDPRHRANVEKRHGITVEIPTVTIVIGRRHDVNNAEIRQLLLEYQGVSVISYDELVDGAVAQLYR